MPPDAQRARRASILKKPSQVDMAVPMREAVAGPSSRRNTFSIPEPTPDQLDEELPEYYADEDIALGALLDRLVRKGYGDLRMLVDQT